MTAGTRGDERESTTADLALHASLLRGMTLMRTLEARAAALYRQGKVPGSFYDGFGQEAIPVGSALALTADDHVCPLHRDLGVHLVRGADPARVLGQYLGREGGYTDGRDANVHFADANMGAVAMVSMLGAMVTVAAGIALAFALADEPRCAVTWIGDGGASTGAFHEALNFAGVRKLPLIVIVENNGYAYSTPIVEHSPVMPAARAAAYGMASEEIDGNDARAVYDATARARARAVAGDGPTLVEARTMRMHGHAAHDDMRYVPKDVVADWSVKDPVALEERRVRELGGEPESIGDEVVALVDEATAAALAMPMPVASGEWASVFCEGDPVPLGTPAAKESPA